MKIRTPVPEKKSRLEIIPLIDIMFFLLASFMMVSLQMQIVRTLKANLPTATLATSTKKPDIVNLNVNKDGDVSVDDKPMAFPELFSMLTNRYTMNTNLPVYITGANDATHGSVMFVLDFVKRAGIRNVAIAVQAAPDSPEPMKNFQQNLLIILALSLCGLCVWQWYGQMVQRETIQTLNQTVYYRNAAIQGYTNSIATLNAKVNDLDTRVAGLKTSIATNEQVMVFQKAQIEQLQFAHDNDTNEIAQYKVAVDTLESKLKDAYTGIDKQNETITNLLSQRDDLVQKYDELATNRNDIVLKYNALVKQMGSGQDGK